MPGMKRDCGGAAAVLGAFRAAVKAVSVCGYNCSVTLLLFLMLCNFIMLSLFLSQYCLYDPFNNVLKFAAIIAASLMNDTIFMGHSKGQ